MRNRTAHAPKQPHRAARGRSIVASSRMIAATYRLKTCAYGITFVLVIGVIHLFSVQANGDDRTTGRVRVPQQQPANFRSRFSKPNSSLQLPGRRTKIPRIVATPLPAKQRATANVSAGRSQATDSQFRHAGFVTLRSLEDQDTEEDEEQDEDDDKRESVETSEKPFVPLSQLFKPVRTIRVTAQMPTVNAGDSQLTTPKNFAAAYRQTVAVERRLPARFGLQQFRSAATRHPLYFEEAAKERAGVGQGCGTTTVSAARFFRTALLLPLKVIGTPMSTMVPLSNR